MIVDGKHTAFLREVAGNKPRRVLAGENVNGMLVAEVKPDRVRLTLGDESEELLLRVGTNPRPTVPPAAPPVAAVPQAPAVPQTATVPPTAGAQEAQTLAERRRAARAAAANTNSPPAPGAPTAAAPAAVDPRWNQMDQAYRDRAAMGGPPGHPIMISGDNPGPAGCGAPWT